MNDFTVKNSISLFLDKHSIYNFSDVKVFVQRGIVLLVGKVLTTKERDYVQASVKRLPGVKRVICKVELATETATAKLPSLVSVLGI